MFKSIPVMSNEFICIVRTKPKDCVVRLELLLPLLIILSVSFSQLEINQLLLSSTKHHWLLNKFLASVFANRSNRKT